MWRLVAEWGNGSKEVCTAYLLSESTLAAMALPSSHEMLELAKRVADLCFAYLKTGLQDKVVGFGDSYEKQNICPLLRQKNDFGKARCGSG